MNPLHILVADDDPQNQSMLSLILKRKGYSLGIASNGVEVIEAVKRKPFDLVLMDVFMPQMDGIEATRQIRASENGGNRIPIIGLTAVIEVEHVHCLQAGMDHVLSKPLDIEELDEVITACISGDNLSTRSISPAKRLSHSVILDTESAIHRVGGDEENYKELLGEFIHSLPARYNELVNAFTSNNWAQLSVRAHNIQGLSSSIGAMDLSRIAMELDQLVNESMPSHTRQKIDEINVGMDKLHKVALAYLSGGHGEKGNSDR